jgi:hypothetical protein
MREIWSRCNFVTEKNLFVQRGLFRKLHLTFFQNSSQLFMSDFFWGIKKHFHFVCQQENVASKFERKEAAPKIFRFSRFSFCDKNLLIYARSSWIRNLRLSPILLYVPILQLQFTQAFLRLLYLTHICMCISTKVGTPSWFRISECRMPQCRKMTNNVDFNLPLPCPTPPHPHPQGLGTPCRG